MNNRKSSTDFQVMVSAKCGYKKSLPEMWDFFFPAVRDRIPDESEAGLVFVRKVEHFNPSRITNPDGWKFAELTAEITA